MEKEIKEKLNLSHWNEKLFDEMCQKKKDGTYPETETHKFINALIDQLEKEQKWRKDLREMNDKNKVLIRFYQKHLATALHKIEELTDYVNY